jgi:pimeloyl-ACP methyl ester carboxylesterase
MGAVAGTALAAAGGWIVYSNLIINHNLPLEKAIDADTLRVPSEESGDINCYVARDAPGRPLLLVHSVNAAASAYEMGPVFNRYRTSRPVIAIDLPGFGLSDRSDRIYSPRVYHEAILDVLHAETSGPVDVVALSLGCEFAARAAVIEPERFNSLTFISPTGFSRRDPTQVSQQASRKGMSERAFRFLSLPLWGRPLFDLLVTRPSIRYFLQQSFTGPVPDDMVDYDYATAHQPGAEHAPLNFISGSLFTEGILPVVIGPIGVALGIDHPERRMPLVASQIMGVLMLRYLLEVEPLASMPAEEVVATIGPTLQRYLTGDLPG